MLEEAAEYAAVVDGWNQALDAEAGARTYRDFCTHVLDVYERRYGSAA